MSANTVRTRAGRRWSALAVLCASLLLVSVDATVLHMALPALSADLRAGGDAQLWIIAIYSLLAAPLLLVFGSLGDHFGRRRVLVAGYVVFGAGSVGAALAPGVAVLIAARAVLGVGAAMIMPATLAVLRRLFSDRAERRVAIGVWSGIAGSGAVLGPLLGGFLVETLSWRAAFLVNLPVLLAALPLTYWLIPESADPPGERWDVIGALFATLGILGITYAVKQTAHGGIEYILGPAAGLAGAVLLVAFVRRQRRRRAPLLDVDLFRVPAFTVAATSVLLMMLTLVGLGLLFAQYLQLVLALSPLEAALRLLFVMVAAVLASMASGPLLQRAGNRAVIVSGFTAGAAALLAAATWLHTEENLWLLGPVLIGLGIAVATSLSAASDMLLAAAPAEQAGAASAVEETGYELGAGLGVALVGGLATGVYHAIFPTVPRVPAETLAIARDNLTAATGIARTLPADVAAALREAGNQSFVTGMRVTLVVGAVVLVVTGVVAATVLPRDRPAKIMDQ